MSLRRYVVYTKENCKYCNMAKSLLNKRKETFSIKPINLDIAADKAFIKRFFPNAKTFPIVLVDGTDIGGYKELVSHFERLDKNEAETRRLHSMVL